MPLDPVKVASAMATGLSAVCATCEKYWRARDQHVPDDRCLATGNCGSPLIGDDFHEYEGPLTAMHLWCFVCGERSAFGVRAAGRFKAVGVCRKHVQLLSELQANGKEPPRITVMNGKGEVPLVLSRTSKTLTSVIAEVEGYYASKRG